MPIQTVFRLKNHALLVALAAAYPLLGHTGEAARLDFASGTVAAMNPAGVSRPVTKGSNISSGDTVVTGDGGRAQLRFTDGGMVSLQPGSEFKVDNYQYTGKEDGEEKGFFSLIKGGLRTITGLVGRTNKNAYKVTTSVATIGIRGTEFTIAYTGSNGIAVSTGEGMIEVCNNAGCAIVPAGSSATVTGPNSEVKRSEVKPRLDPAQPTTTQQATYSTSEERTASGSVMPVSTPMASGATHYMTWAGGYNSSYNIGTTSNPVTATFSATSELTSVVDGSNTYQAKALAGAFSMDGVVAWGRWTDGTVASGTNSPYTLKDFHYVVGTPVALPSMTSGTVLTYQLAGYTLPTSDGGLVGSAPTGNITVTYGGSTSANLNMTIAIGGTTKTLAESLTLSGGKTFSSSSTNGFFAGTNASHAALTYKYFEAGLGSGQYVAGAAAFKR